MSWRFRKEVRLLRLLKFKRQVESETEEESAKRTLEYVKQREAEAKARGTWTEEVTGGEKARGIKEGDSDQINR